MEICVKSDHLIFIIFFGLLYILKAFHTHMQIPLIQLIRRFHRLSSQNDL